MLVHRRRGSDGIQLFSNKRVTLTALNPEFGPLRPREIALKALGSLVFGVHELLDHAQNEAGSGGGRTQLEPVIADISLRPVRLGFLVDPRDLASVRRVMRMATTMWGGMMCPIIPVMKRLPSAWAEKHFSGAPQQISRGYIRFFEPDLLVQTKSGQLAVIGVDEEPSWSARHRFCNFEDLLRTDHGLVTDLNVGTNISWVYQHLYKEEYQFKKRIDPKIFYFKEDRSVNVAFYEAAFGCFPKDLRLSYLRKNYKQAFAAEEVACTFEAWHDLIENGAGYPLHYTVRGADVKYADRRDPAIFIFDPAKATDLIDFWNFRLFTRDVIPVNANWLEESRDLMLHIVRNNYRPLPTNPNGIMIRTAIHVARSLSLDDAIKRLDLAAAKLPEHSVSVQGWYETIWYEPESDERVFRPAASTMAQKARQVQLTPTGDDYITLQFPVQAPDFNISLRGNGSAFVNVVKLRQYQSKKEIADALPAATFGSRDRYPVRGSGKQFHSREGYVTLHTFAHDNAYLRLPSSQSAISSWLETKGIKAIPSDAGRVAEQIIDSVGGLNGTAILRERSILHQLDKMARSRVEWKDGTADEYSDRTSPALEWQKLLKPLQKKVFGDWKTLDRLVADGILKLGLSPRCPKCTQENWYSFDDVGSDLTCARCLKSYPFPQGNPDRKLFKYRVVGPFATPGFARGGYAVALTLQFLQHQIGSMNEFTFATGMELTHANGISETDFFAWYGKDRIGRSSRDPITLVGECKSFATECFKPKDFARLRELGSLLPGAYLVAATLKDELSAKEIEGFRRVARWGWTQLRPSPLIILTGVELFADDPFSHAWKDHGGARAAVVESHPYIFDFDTLADATQQAILGMTSEEVAAARYKRSRALAVKRTRLQREI